MRVCDRLVVGRRFWWPAFCTSPRRGIGTVGAGARRGPRRGANRPPPPPQGITADEQNNIDIYRGARSHR